MMMTHPHAPGSSGRVHVKPVKPDTPTVVTVITTEMSYTVPALASLATTALLFSTAPRTVEAPMPNRGMCSMTVASSSVALEESSVAKSVAAEREELQGEDRCAGCDAPGTEYSRTYTPGRHVPSDSAAAEHRPSAVAAEAPSSVPSSTGVTSVTETNGDRSTREPSADSWTAAAAQLPTVPTDVHGRRDTVDRFAGSGAEVGAVQGAARHDRDRAGGGGAESLCVVHAEDELLFLGGGCSSVEAPQIVVSHLPGVAHPVHHALLDRH
ncbi:hypothetical protein FOA52_011185 [Chlamydomonas sp. UWO 241]|nr:hypothetical protein FOA52_011185 [Chlamydomonas sp. UWO 241]